MYLECANPAFLTTLEVLVKELLLMNHKWTNKELTKFKCANVNLLFDHLTYQLTKTNHVQYLINFNYK